MGTCFETVTTNPSPNLVARVDLALVVAQAVYLPPTRVNTKGHARVVFDHKYLSCQGRPLLN